MNMCMVYGIASQKGGVGKSSVTLSLGVELANKGYKVLLIDTDAQGSLTASMGYREPDSMEVTLSTVLEKIVNGLMLMMIYIPNFQKPLRTIIHLKDGTHPRKTGSIIRRI